MYTFVPNKPYGSLLEILPTNHIVLKTFNSEFQEIKVWFADQTSKPLEVEERINVTLIKCNSHCIKMGYSVEARDIGKKISNKYTQKFVDSAIKSGATKVATNAIKTASKRAIEQTSEAAGDLIGNKIVDMITSVSKKPTTKLHDE